MARFSITRPCMRVTSVVFLTASFCVYILISLSTNRRYENVEICCNPGSRPLAVLYGDSLTKFGSRVDPLGWAFLLDDLYDGRLDILNRGHSGYNSRWARLLFPQYFQSLPTSDRKSLLFLFLGANDSVLPGRRTYVPLDEFEENMHFLLEMLQNPRIVHSQSSLRTIIVITPPPVDEKVRAMNLEKRNPPQALDRLNKNTRKYADAVVKIANEADGKHGVPVYSIDLFSKIENSGLLLSDVLVDGLHLTAAGNRILFDAIVDILKKLPDYNPESMGWDYPHHAKINHADPQLSFHFA